MILLPVLNSENIAAAEALSQQYPNANGVKPIITSCSRCEAFKAGQKLFVVDVGQASRLFERYPVNVVFNDCIKKINFSQSLQDIYFVVSDINKNDNLLCYAQKLSDLIYTELQWQVTVHVSTALGYDKTIVTKTDKGWLVSGENQSRKSASSLLAYNSPKNHELWFGKNIVEEWLNDVRRVVDASSHPRQHL